MTEDNINVDSSKPQEEFSIKTNNGDAANDADGKDAVITVKFNKEVKQLSLEEATVLAQKGMKYDLISKDYAILKKLSESEGKSVTAFLESLKAAIFENKKQKLAEKCGGNEELVAHILKLEEEKNEENDLGFSEVKEYFPQYKSIDDLPGRVVEASKLKGTFLLDELLRYRLVEKKKIDAAIKNQKSNELLSIGSQVNRKGAENPEAAEFLKGLWK